MTDLYILLPCSDNINYNKYRDRIIGKPGKYIIQYNKPCIVQSLKDRLRMNYSYTKKISVHDKYVEDPKSIRIMLFNIEMTHKLIDFRGIILTPVWTTLH